MTKESTAVTLTPIDIRFVRSAIKRTSKTGTLIKEFLRMNVSSVRVNNADKYYASTAAAYVAFYKWLRRHNDIPVRVTQLDNEIYLVRTDIEED